MNEHQNQNQNPSEILPKIVEFTHQNGRISVSSEVLMYYVDAVIKYQLLGFISWNNVVSL